MIKKKDLVKIFYIYICLCHVCPAHPCGGNPLRNIIYISNKTGRSLHSVLRTLRVIDDSAYRQLQSLFHNYAVCVGMVDTGYFKRSYDGQKRFHAQSLFPVTPAENSLQLYDLWSVDSRLDNQIKQKSRKNVLQRALSNTKELIDRNADYPDDRDMVENRK